MQRLVVAFLGLSCLVLACQAQDSTGKFNKKIALGATVPDFTGLRGVDGKDHSLADYKDKDVLVLVATCNSCPVARAYESRLIEFTKEFVAAPGSKVGLIAFDSNNTDAERLPQMQEHAQEAGFNFPYLYDDGQQVGRRLGASVTPEFFVFDKARKLVYTGAMDNNQNPDRANKHYLQDAVQAVIKGETPPVQETRPFGCGIRYSRTN